MITSHLQKTSVLTCTALASILLPAVSTQALTVNLSASPATNDGPYAFNAATNTFNAPNAPGTTTIDAPMTGSGILLLQNIDSNNAVRGVQLNAQSTYTGITRLKSVDARFGVILGVDNALPTTTAVQFETTNNGSGRPVWLDLNGYSQELTGIGQSGPTYNAIVNGNTGTAGALIINNSSNVTYGSHLGEAGAQGNIAPQVGGAGNNFSLTKKGNATLNLLLAFDYTGDTSVEAGTLQINTASLNDAADIKLLSGAAFNLNFAGTDDINALWIDGAQQATGTWGAIGSGATNQSSLITGTGLLNVAVPEPSSLALLGLGGLLIARRRR